MPVKKEHWVSEVEEEPSRWSWLTNYPEVPPPCSTVQGRDGLLPLPWREATGQCPQWTRDSRGWTVTLHILILFILVEGTLASPSWSYPTICCQLKINSEEAGRRHCPHWVGQISKSREVKWYSKAHTKGRCSSRIRQGLSGPQGGALCSHLQCGSLLERSSNGYFVPNLLMNIPNSF